LLQKTAQQCSDNHPSNRYSRLPFTVVMESVQTYFFLDQLRSARAAALADAEGFHAILRVLELYGQLLKGKVSGLRVYEPMIFKLASVSPLAVDLPSQWPGCHTEFSALYGELRNARNDAMHQGAYARTLTGHAVELAIILEDALMSNIATVSQFMVRDVVEAKPWQPVSYVRQQMLAHAYSFLPIWYQNVWRLIPDYTIARYLRSTTASPRSRRLGKTVSNAVEEKMLELITANIVSPDARVDKILHRITEQPLLVIDSAHEDVLVGVLTASDVL
jgi:predicted transcriptional regulator